jgi:hypothetical protein
MRSVEDIRSRKLACLTSLFEHPSMYGAGQYCEAEILGLLEDLAFIDETSERFERAHEDLRRRGLFGKLGVWGVFAGVAGPGDHTDRVASVYARLAAALGYLIPARRLTREEWEAARLVEAWVSGGVRRRADIEARFGPPSHVRKGQRPTVLCYAGPSDDSWLYFDLVEQGDDPEVEMVRLPRESFADCVLDVRPRANEEEPEEVYRRFLIAALTGDDIAIERLALAHPARSALRAHRYPSDVGAVLAEQCRTMSVQRVDSPDHVVWITSDVLPFPMAVVRDGAAWRVDADPLIEQWRNTSATGK